MSDAQHNALKLEFRNILVQARITGMGNYGSYENLKNIYRQKELTDAEMDAIRNEVNSQNPL